jgi:hypothetical protein
MPIYGTIEYYQKVDFELHQKLTRAAIQYAQHLEKGADYDTLMESVQKLEDAADAWANRRM